LAIRAAFKAACDGKQVAVLVPTTILALQHYRTFSERLKDFPCTVDYLSRLRSAKDIKEIQQRLKEGKIDIIIGTHRLINKKIEFKDLGLLIIDEEQKFGVTAKERLRQLKASVDTLTLTATPIPRTLQFSLLGARDLSIINTPPPNRLPVYTEVIPFEDDSIAEIISREMERGGQIFFVHNKIEDINSVYDILHRIVPEAEICIAHGRMEAEVLEKKIIDFIDGEYDILLSTSIMENGIDIPNANTIIINQAQKFGLSDLHQLRGRVGRSNVKAYCYLVVPPIASLTEDARRRIRAIEAFSDLGSGFNIAMQDLDIRGAGNLLGAEQSGFIAEMGFETYMRILNEAMAELPLSIKAEEEANREHQVKQARIPVLPASFRETVDTQVETDLEALIPDEYVNVQSEKIRLYKELDAMSSEKELERFQKEAEDRFGPIPPQLEELMNVVRLRRAAQGAGIERVVIKSGTMLCYFISNQMSPFYTGPAFGKILDNINRNGSRFQFKEGNGKIYVKSEGVESVKRALHLVGLLSEGV
ncbi:MAG: DEAD/DEAH box helicase, partial [Bacteroidales bacterium]|nr:DEAD/DEAH box helicase [Bacteroidales bacterium]